MMLALRRATLAAALLLCGAGLVRVTGAAREFARAIERGGHHSTTLEAPISLAGVLVQGAGPGQATAHVPLASLADGVVFVFDPECGPCNLNVSNWIDVVAASADGHVGLYALGVVDLAEALDYWRPLASVTPLVTDVPTMERLGIGGTPATLVVRDGELVWMHTGPLGTTTLRGLVEFARGTARPFGALTRSGAGETG
jgi:hypothetical protein